MAPDQMLRELQLVARRLGLDVRFEPFDVGRSSRGGLCMVHGAPVVLVDARGTTLDKVAVLCQALSRFDIEVLYLPPLLRARIQRSSS